MTYQEHRLYLTIFGRWHRWKNGKVYVYQFEPLLADQSANLLRVARILKFP